jgi:hypothetical protein
MKIRTGFVSNSSSSSFLIFGKILSSDEIAKIFKFTDDERKRIDSDGLLYDYEGKPKLKNYLCKRMGDEWIIGTKLKGNGIEIIRQVFDTERDFGQCKLYSGIDADGELSFDDE